MTEIKRRKINKPLSVKKYVAHPENWSYKEIGLLLWKSYIKIEEIMTNADLSNRDKELAILDLPVNSLSYYHYFYTQKNNPEKAEHIKKIKYKWVNNLKENNPEKYKAMRKEQLARYYLKRKNKRDLNTPEQIAKNIASKEYLKQWYIKNKVKISQIYIKNKAKISDIYIKREEADPEKYKAKRRESYIKGKNKKLNKTSPDTPEQIAKSIAIKKHRKEYHKQRYINNKVKRKDRLEEKFIQHLKEEFLVKSKSFKDVNLNILKSRLERLKLLKLLYPQKESIWTIDCKAELFSPGYIVPIELREPKNIKPEITITSEIRNGKIFYLQDGKDMVQPTECVPELECTKTIDPRFIYKSFTQKYVEDDSHQVISRNGYSFEFGKFKYKTPDFLMRAIKKYMKINGISNNSKTFSQVRHILYKTIDKPRYKAEYEKYKKYRRDFAPKK